MKLFIIGLFSGVISGMGIGGGTILIPSLIFFSSISQHQAQGINLIVFLPIAVVALITHYKNKSISFKIAIPVIISGLVGALIGSIMAINLTSIVLKKLFGVFLLLMGLYQIFSKVKSKKTS